MDQTSREKGGAPKGDHDLVGELVGEALDEVDEGGVVGEEALDAREVGAAVGDGLGDVGHGPPRLLRRERGGQRRRRPLPRRCHRRRCRVLLCSPPILPTKPKPCVCAEEGGRGGWELGVDGGERVRRGGHLRRRRRAAAAGREAGRPTSRPDGSSVTLPMCFVS